MKRGPRLNVAVGEDAAGGMAAGEPVVGVGVEATVGVAAAAEAGIAATVVIAETAGNPSNFRQAALNPARAEALLN
jgi:hypothetical protein